MILESETQRLSNLLMVTLAIEPNSGGFSFSVLCAICPKFNIYFNCWNFLRLCFVPFQIHVLFKTYCECFINSIAYLIEHINTHILKCLSCCCITCFLGVRPVISTYSSSLNLFLFCLVN